MIVGLQRAAKYMTDRGRPTSWTGLHSLLTRGRHPGFGQRVWIGDRRVWTFTEEELDRLIERLGTWRRTRAYRVDRPRDHRGRFLPWPAMREQAG